VSLFYADKKGAEGEERLFIFNLLIILCIYMSFEIFVLVKYQEHKENAQ